MRCLIRLLQMFGLSVVEITSCEYTETIILSNLGEKWQNIYLAASQSLPLTFARPDFPVSELFRPVPSHYRPWQSSSELF